MDADTAKTAAMVSKIYATAVDEAQELGGEPERSIGQYLRQKWLEARHTDIYLPCPIVKKPVSHCLSHQGRTTGSPLSLLDSGTLCPASMMLERACFRAVIFCRHVCRSGRGLMILSGRKHGGTERGCSVRLTAAAPQTT